MCVCLRADLKPRDYGEQNTDPAQVKPDNIREVIRLSELYLDGIIRFAIAADARGLSLSGMFAGATTALAAGGLTLLLTRDYRSSQFLWRWPRLPQAEVSSSAC
jgi:hypothetical protein